MPKQIVPANFILHNPHDVTTQHLLTSGGDRAQEPPIPPSVAKRIKILENALEEQDQRLESMRLAFERIRGIHLFENSKKAIPMDDREDAYTIRDTVGGETVDGRRTVDGNEADEAVAIVVGGGQRELDDIIDSHVGEVERLKEVGGLPHSRVPTLTEVYSQLYFFHLALQIKVRAHAAYPARAARRGEPQSDRTQPPLVSLQDLWEEFHEQKVPVDKWASKISAKFGMKKKEK